MTLVPVLECRSTKTPPRAETRIVLATTEPSARQSATHALEARLRKSRVFLGKWGSHALVRYNEAAQGAEHVLFVGIGDPRDLTAERCRQLGGTLWSRLNAERISSVNFDIAPLGTGAVSLAAALLEGLALAAYQFDGYRSKPSEPPVLKRVWASAADATDVRELGAQIARIRATAELVSLVRDWSNEPSNMGTPEYYANQTRKLARSLGLRVRVLGPREIERQKMGLFVSVSQGSEREGRVVIVEYTPKRTGGKRGKREALKTVALVGKGVTFDSGGISIKPSLRMEDMKHDMTGAASVVGAVALAARWGAPNRVVGVVGFCENMPDGRATQPGNVMRARNGKTVEIINTDAEGRLILADLLDLAHDYHPDIIVDVATLTGAVSVALGKQCCAILGNDAGLIESVRKAGLQHGERIWELPLFEEYLEDMKSDVADLKNSANDGNGGTIRGAIFLQQFIKKGQKWAHLDIASTAYGLTHLSYFPKRGATGAYVRTLAQLAESY